MNMNKVISQVKNPKLKTLMLRAQTASLCFLASKGMYYATSAETDLGQNIETTSGKFLNELAAVYCNSLCWLILGVNLCFLFFSKNDKLIGFAKKAVIGCIAVYVILKILTSGDSNTITNTTDSITNWMSNG